MIWQPDSYIISPRRSAQEIHVMQRQNRVRYSNHVTSWCDSCTIGRPPDQILLRHPQGGSSCSGIIRWCIHLGFVHAIISESLYNYCLSLKQHDFCARCTGWVTSQMSIKWWRRKFFFKMPLPIPKVHFLLKIVARCFLAVSFPSIKASSLWSCTHHVSNHALPQSKVQRIIRRPAKADSIYDDKILPIGKQLQAKCTYWTRITWLKRA